VISLKLLQVSVNCGKADSTTSKNVGIILVWRLGNYNIYLMRAM